MRKNKTLVLKREIPKVVMDPLPSLETNEGKLLMVNAFLALVEKLRWSLSSSHIDFIVLGRLHDRDNCPTCINILWADTVLAILSKG